MGPAGQDCAGVGAMMDIFPTFLRLAGGEPSGVDGLDILPMVCDGAKSPHDRIFWEYGDQLAVREGKWKLVLNGKLDFNQDQPDSVHLSDLEADPGERVNLQDKEPRIVRELTERAQEWLAKVTAA